jgi:hypothetical protein
MVEKLETPNLKYSKSQKFEINLVKQKLLE